MTTPSDAIPQSSTAPGVRVRASELRGRGWLNTGGADLTLEDLRGKVVVLDFWTFCCVNCLHVLEELRPVEEKWSEEIVVVGVHSPKFEFEKDPDALAANVERYEVTHPVLDDPELRTWSEYAVKAWPTLVVLDTHGRIASSMSGEGHAENLDALIGRLVAEGEADGSLRRGPAPTVIAERTPQRLRFPSKLAQLPDGRVIVSDSGQHRLVILEADGTTVSEVIGSGLRGHADGEEDAVRFAEPNGIAVLPEEVAEAAGVDLVVADTAGNRLRGVSLGRDRLLRGRIPSTVTTLAGTGAQWMQGQPLPVGQGDPQSFALSTPWDLTWSDELSAVVITMAGIHQMWVYEPIARTLAVLGGTTNEGLVDGALVWSWWAQPSGVDRMADGTIVVADSETSAVRVIDPHALTVRTLVGTGLFDFGHVDGPFESARLQHPLGVTALPDGRIAVSDTYNGAVRLVDPAAGTVVTVATDLAEPSDALVVDPIDGVDQLLVVESGAHRLTFVPIAKAAERHIDEGAQHSERPATQIAPGTFSVRVLFTPPEGQKMDESYGPSTQVSISSTPVSMIVSGGGTGTDMHRTLELDPACAEGVLHVSARAASCDADPTVEFPACHMHQQDWGVPVRIVDGGADTLDLALLG